MFFHFPLSIPIIPTRERSNLQTNTDSDPISILIHVLILFVAFLFNLQAGSVASPPSTGHQVPA